MSAHKKQKIKHALVDVVPHLPGDMVIQIGKDGDIGNVRVHKATMIMASPVIRASLQGRFKESTLELTEADPFILQEYDREAFITMCRMLHNQPGDFLKTNDDYAKLAVVVDCYGCAAYVLPNILARLRGRMKVERDQEVDHNDEEVEMLRNILCMAYLAGDGILLRDISKYAVMHLSPSYFEFDSDSLLLSLVPGKLIEEIKALRIHQIELFHKYLIKDVVSCIRDECDAPEDCQRARDLVGICMLKFAYLSEGPNSSIAGTGSVRKIVAYLRTIGAETEELIEDEIIIKCKCDECCDVPDGGSRFDIDKLIEATIQHSLSKRLGLCLECYRSSGTFVSMICSHMS